MIVWLFTGGRGSSHAAERRAQQLIAVSYALLVAYVGVEAIRDLVGSHHPGVSWVFHLASATLAQNLVELRSTGQPRVCLELVEGLLDPHRLFPAGSFHCLTRLALPTWMFFGFSLGL